MKVDYTMLQSATQITGHFSEVKRLYFPRWDRKGLWRVEIAGRELCRDATGYCDSKRRRVFMYENQVYTLPTDGLRALLIHEICHDVAAAGHNLRWAKRMKLAEGRAQALGEEHVAELLCSEIFSYTNAEICRAVGVEYRRGYR